MTIIDPSQARDDIPPREKPLTEEEVVDILKEKGFHFNDGVKFVKEHKLRIIKLFIISTFLVLSAYSLVVGFSILRASEENIEWLDGVTFGSSTCTYHPDGNYTCIEKDYPTGKFYNDEITDLAKYDYYLIWGYAGMLFGVIRLLCCAISLLIAIILYHVWSHE